MGSQWCGCPATGPLARGCKETNNVADCPWVMLPQPRLAGLEGQTPPHIQAGIVTPKSRRYLGKVPRLAVHEKQLARGNSGIQMDMGTSQLCIFDDVPPGGARSFALHRLAPCREAASGQGEVRESDALA